MDFRNRSGSRLMLPLLITILCVWAPDSDGVEAAEFEILPSLQLESAGGTCCVLLDLVVPRNVTKAQYRVLQSVKVPSIVGGDGEYRITADRIRSILSSVLRSSFVLTGSESTVLQLSDPPAATARSGGSIGGAGIVVNAGDDVGREIDAVRHVGVGVASARSIGDGSGDTLNNRWYDDSRNTINVEERRSEPLVRTGDQVTAIYRNGAMEVSLDAMALGSGEAGGEITVRPEGSGKRLRAVVVREGVVRVVLTR